MREIRSRISHAERIIRRRASGYHRPVDQVGGGLDGVGVCRDNVQMQLDLSGAHACNRMKASATIRQMDIAI